MANSSHNATFFITTARSGTQWLCETLRRIYPELVVELEPIQYAYAPKRCLRNAAALAALRGEPVVRQHLDDIHEVLRLKSYVEIGFPVFAAAPLMAEEFGKRLRLVQLVRHPVRVAASIVTHKWFDPGARKDIEASITLEPTNPGVRLQHYRERWPNTSSFEKALFYWAEVHRYGLDVRRELPTVPFLEVTFEDLLTRDDARKQLTNFLEVPYRPAWNESPAKRVDNFRRQTGRRMDFSEVHRHPEIVALAERFGYDLDKIDKRSFQVRYQSSWTDRAIHKLRRVLPRSVRGGIRKIRGMRHLLGMPVAQAYYAAAAGEPWAVFLA